MGTQKNRLLILLDLALPGGEESCAAKRQMFADYLDRGRINTLVQLVQIWVAAGTVQEALGNKILTILQDQ